MFQLSDSKLALMFQGYHEINGIGKSTCQNLCFFSFFFFFFTAGVSDASEPCRRHVRAASEPCQRIEKRKRKKGTLPDTGIRRVVPVPVSDTCRTWTRRQKWRVRATQFTSGLTRKNQIQNSVFFSHVYDRPYHEFNKGTIHHTPIIHKNYSSIHNYYLIISLHAS